MANQWTPESWKQKPIKQIVEYEDQVLLGKALKKISSLPPLIDDLKEYLKQCALGHCFLLQGGDCAELFEYCTELDLLVFSYKLINRIDLEEPKNWDMGHVQNPILKEEYFKILKELSEALKFMKTIGAVEPENQQINTVDIFTSHECLLLQYEEALTRCFDIKGQKKYYNTSAHFLWVGDRTRQLDHAHIEYLSGIENPIGIKCGPTTDFTELVLILDKLNPKFEVGKITLITRYGVDLVEKHLPNLIKAVNQTKHNVVWCCDPMHGNTETMKENSLKTRRFDKIISELTKTFAIHTRYESRLNGVHFELTGDNVTECLGGSMELKVSSLSKNYQSFCDPRLNYDQSLDMAFLISRYLSLNDQ